MDARRQENIDEIDRRVKKMAEGLRAEGYESEVEFPNENNIIVRVGGKELNFTKLPKYDIITKDEKGNSVSVLVDIEKVIEAEIRKFGK